MAEFIIIAGPQASGKSTVITKLSEQCRNVFPLLSRTKKGFPILFPLQESRQIIVHQNILLGAIFMTPEQEIEVVQCDLRRMDLILSREDDRSLVYLDECNIFTIAHAAAHGVTQISEFWQEYLARLEKLEAKVIFLDVPPETSWLRRKQRYEERLIYFPETQYAGIMDRYHEYINRLYPELLEVYEKIPLPKSRIEANCPVSAVLQKASENLAQISSLFREKRES